MLLCWDDRKNTTKRFLQHKSGYKSNSYAKKYGIGLRPWYYEKLNPMTEEEAKKMEIEKTRRLWKRGLWSLV